MDFEFVSIVHGYTTAWAAPEILGDPMRSHVFAFGMVVIEVGSHASCLAPLSVGGGRMNPSLDT